MARPTEEKKDETVKFRLPADLYAKAKEKASRNGISLSEYVRKLVKRDILAEI